MKILNQRTILIISFLFIVTLAGIVSGLNFGENDIVSNKLGHGFSTLTADPSLGSLSDVNIALLSTDDILQYDGSEWINTSLGDISGMTATGFSATSPLTIATTSSSVLYGITQADTDTDGYLSSTDWNTFNNKVTFPGFTSLSVDYSFTDNSTNWDTAYSWGDHSGLYDILGQATSTLNSHTSTYNHDNYNTAYSWGDWNGNIDISEDTNLVAGDNINLSNDTLNVFPFSPSITLASSTWESINGTGTSTIPVGVATQAETWSSVWCYTDTGTANARFGDGTNYMTGLALSSTVASTTVSSNNTFTSGEKRYIQVGTFATSPNFISCTINKVKN